VRIASILALALFCSALPDAQAPQPGPDAATIQRGKLAYVTWCTPCHGSNPAGRGRFGGTGFPGTDALAVKYRGRQPPVPAALEQRSDLTSATIKLVVRQGVSVMPFFRKTEISDTDLDALIAYLLSLRPATR
jgi:mono/diheme cytochrome c family protein